MTYNSELTENGANQATDTYSTDDSYIGKETAGSGETIISFHTWDQSDYIYRNDGTQSNIYSYNRYTPCTPNNYTVAGSIPIAACQLIYYWGCLQNTLGADVTVDSIEFSSEDYYTTDTLGFYVADNLFCCFQTMANTLTDINYNFDAQEIAALSFGIGVKLQADYGYNINDTTANISDVDDVLRDLGFTAQCVTDYKAGLLKKSGFDLESELQENIGKDQPVIVELKDSNLGLSHAAIIDGYNSRTGEYHFNMGLGGNYDGWYALDDLPYGDDIITGIVYNVTLPTDTDTDFADGDFNGDGKSDILFSNGTSIGYYASGQSSAWTPLGDFAAGWEIAGNADFDGDNKSDILFCNGTSTGFYSGGSSASWTQTGDISSGWDVVDCSDFDGSGKDDILCSDGTSIGYYADGTNAWTSLGTYSSGWDIVETGDFNGDDSDDILFSNGTSIGYYGAGQSSNWTDLGTYASGAGWDIVDVGDFNDDTVDDILFSNGSSIGYYGGGHSTNWTYLGDYASGAGWNIAGIGDFDGDGSDDILFSNSNSYSIGYYGSGLPSNWTDLGTYSSAWEIVVA